MVYNSSKRRVYMLVIGVLFITLILVIPLVAYGIIVNNSTFLYPKTVCYYKGYHISKGDCKNINTPYAGILEFGYNINNTKVSRTIQIICAESKNKIRTYFGKYNNTTWPCWYQRDHPKTGWVGFRDLYDVNGTPMIISGILIFILIFVMTGVYFYINHRNNGYGRIN